MYVAALAGIYQMGDATTTSDIVAGAKPVTYQKYKELLESAIGAQVEPYKPPKAIDRNHPHTPYPSNWVKGTVDIPVLRSMDVSEYFTGNVSYTGTHLLLDFPRGVLHKMSFTRANPV
jgi:hypothetical protein